MHLKSMVLVLIAKTTVYMHLRALHCTANYTLCFWTNKIYFIKTPGHNWLSQCLFTKDFHRYIMHIYTWQVFKHQKSTVKYLTVHTHVFVLSNFLAKHFGGCRDDYKYLKYTPLVHILGIYTVHVLVKYFTKLFWILTVWLIIYTDGIGGLEFSRNLEIFIELISQPLFNPLPMSRFSCIVKLSTNWWCNTQTLSFPLSRLQKRHIVC